MLTNINKFIRTDGMSAIILVSGGLLTALLCISQAYSDILHGTVYYLMTGFFMLWLLRTGEQFVVSGIITTVGIVAGFILGHEHGTGPLVNRMFSVLVVWFGVWFAMRYQKTLASDKKNRSQLNAVFDNVGEAILLVGAEGKILMGNPGAVRIFGYDSYELEGMTIEQLVPERYRSAHAGFRHDYHKSGDDRSIGTGREIVALHKTGREFPVELGLSSYRDKSEMYVIAFVTDITARKAQEAKILAQYEQLRELNVKLEDQVKVRTTELVRALEAVRKTNDSLTLQIESRKRIEEQLRTSQALYKAVARNFPDGIIAILNSDLKYVFVEGKELAGYLVHENANVNRVFDGLHRFVLENHKRELKKSFEGEKITFEVETSDRFYEVIATPLREGDRPASEVIVVIRNITRYKKYEDGLKKALEKEKQLNALKSSFVSNVSHEFRTPLTTILSSLYLIEKYNEQDAVPQRRNHINRIRRSVNTLTELLEDFLSLEKLSEGKVAVHMSQFDLRAFVADFISEIEPIKKADQSISFTWNGGDDALVCTDRTILSNVLNNLVSNAIKYSPPGGEIKITLETTPLKAIIGVKDNGMGIPAEDQKHIFERFYRAENAANIQGTGLGLNLVQRYLTLLQGSIRFESTLDVGTTFFVEFPVSFHEKLSATSDLHVVV